MRTVTKKTTETITLSDEEELDLFRTIAQDQACGECDLDSPDVDQDSFDKRTFAYFHCSGCGHEWSPRDDEIVEYLVERAAKPTF